MIAQIQGKVIHLSAPMAIIKTSSGVGYEIELSVPAFCQLHLNKEVMIWTFHHIREDAQLLYGFTTHRDREVFRQLIKINGVGAKMALAMMSNLSIPELKDCVESENESMLVRIPGIGKKTAQRLLIELKDKLNNIEILSGELSIENPTDILTGVTSSIVLESKAALMSLGYKDKEAEYAIKSVQKEGNYPDTQSLLKAALKQLSK